MSTIRDVRKRVVAILAAVLFLFTSSVLSILVILQIKKDNDQNKQNAAIKAALEQSQAQQQTQRPADTTNTTTPKENKLQGTQLANFTATASVPTLQAIDTTPGTGDEVKAGDTITAHYTGAVAATGVIFQSSHDGGQPIAFGLNQVIKGWTDGVPGMKVGGTRRLLIPAAQAYGANPPAGSGIPANADLVFDIELVKIGK